MSGGKKENLKPRKKGDPPLNPTGANQYTKRREYLNGILDELGLEKMTSADGKTTITADRAFWMRVRQDAIKGLPDARRLWAEYRFGKPTDSIDRAVEDGNLGLLPIILPANGTEPKA